MGDGALASPRQIASEMERLMAEQASLGGGGRWTRTLKQRGARLRRRRDGLCPCEVFFVRGAPGQVGLSLQGREFHGLQLRKIRGTHIYMGSPRAAAARSGA
jgi:hypothetical protein